MKKISSSKIIFLLSAVFAPPVLADITLKIDQDLTIGNEPVVPVMSLDGNMQYHLSPGPNRQLQIQTEHAVICNRIDDYEPISAVTVRLNDPNGDNKGDASGVNDSVLGVQSNVSYSIRRKTLEITSENRSKSLCLSSPEFDIIFATRFGDLPDPKVSNISYELIGAPVGGYTPGDDMEYEITYTNNSLASELVDMIEYFPYTSNSPAYFAGNSVSMLVCQVLDDNDNNIQFCSSNNGVIKNINLLPGYKIKLAVRRPISNSATVGESIELMTAVFPKVSTIDGIGSNQSFAGFDWVTLLVPIAKSN